jgi:hypothetical protein
MHGNQLLSIEDQTTEPFHISSTYILREHRNFQCFTFKTHKSYVRKGAVRRYLNTQFFPSIDEFLVCEKDW